MLHRVQVTHISTSTVQRTLHESGLHGRIAAKKPLLKDTNKKKSKFEIFGSNCHVFVRCRVGEWMISTCVASRLLEKPRLCKAVIKAKGGGYLKNLKSQIYFYLLNTFLVTTYFHMCYYIVLMSSLLFYNVENSKNKEKPLNE